MNIMPQTKFLILLFLGIDVSASPTRRVLQQNDTSATAQPQTHNWWEFGMADPVLDEVALYFLGHTWFQGADVADCLETMYRTNNSDPWSWTMEWRQTAARLEKLAADSESAGHTLNAGQAYLRAATYHRASLHRHPDPFHPEVQTIAQQAVDAFAKFMNLTRFPCESVTIPYENTTLPGYLCLNPNVRDPAPTIIFNEGKDGWMEDGKYVVDEAMKRGYNVLLWDGPGMGRVIRLQGLPFRVDWENVLGPVIDYLERIPQVDASNLALISVSLGGFLGPRAAIFDHRLKALIPNSAVVNWYSVYEKEISQIDPGLLDLLEVDPEAFDAAIYQVMNASAFFAWGLVDSMWHHGVDSPHALMNEIQKYNIEGMIGNITAATLVIDAEAETRGQAEEFYQQLQGRDNQYILFTAEEAAQFHVQPGATAILSHKTFNWLDDILSPEGVNEPVNNNGSSGSSYIRLSCSTIAALFVCFWF